MAKRPNKKQSRTASFEGVGKGFEAEQEYLIRVKECSVEEGDNGLYYALKLEGTGEFEGSLMYHNASLSPAALWRTREVFEAFLGEVPDGDFDVDEYAEEFVGKTAMCSTYRDTYNGKVSIKPEDFWAAEGADDAGSEIDLDDIEDDDILKLAKELKVKGKKADDLREKLAEVDSEDLVAAMEKLGLIEDKNDGGDDGEDIDFDEIEDDDIKALGKKMGIKAKKPADIREALAEEDAGEVKEAMEELGIELDGSDGEGDDAPDLDELDDDQIKAVAKAAGVKGKKVKDLKAALAELDADDLKSAFEEAGIGAEALTADAINEMSQDELEALVEKHELEVDFDKLKTLRKMRAAVVDAAEEEGLLE